MAHGPAISRGVDAVLHLAARHSTPDASWEEALGSYNMTLNVLTAAATVRAPAGVLIVEPCHGWLQDQPLAARMGPGKLTAQTEPAPGTRAGSMASAMHSLAYGTSR